MPEKSIKIKTTINDIERERLIALINSMADGVLAVDEDLKIVIYNGAALNILDINSTMIGVKLNTVLKIQDKTNENVDLGSLIKSTTTQLTSREWHILYPSGEKVNLYLSIAPVKLGYGQSGSKGYVLLLRDITKEKSLEEERDEFISVVSHELRTPIAIAEGNISNAKFVLEKTGDTTQITNALDEAHNQINFLSGLINDLATLSRAERGKLTVEVEEINVYELLNELAKNYTPEASSKKIDFTSKIDPHLEMLTSSRLYVKEILQNFLTNAIKYTEKGSITLGAKPFMNGVEVTISDSGIGISKSDQDKIFNKFFRSEDYRTRQNSGTGLGLYVTAKLAKLIHAEIKLESELDKGSTFTILIPNLQ